MRQSKILTGESRLSSLLAWSNFPITLGFTDSVFSHGHFNAFLFYTLDLTHADRVVEYGQGLEIRAYGKEKRLVCG